MPLETLSRIHRSPRLSEEVSAALEARILRGDHPPGSQLPTEKVFAETFGVSRAVVREAIARLKADGLIETRQGAGALGFREVDLIDPWNKMCGGFSAALGAEGDTE